MLRPSVWAFIIGLISMSLIAFMVSRAAVIHQAPRAVMATLEARIVQAAGGWNTCYHNRIYGPRQNAARRANPDSIISSMAYDVSNGPVRVSGEVWPRYWSLSLYQQNSDNFFVINDRELNADRFDFVITSGDPVGSAASGRVIQSPTQKGIMLVRRFAADAEDMPAIIENQAAMHCGVE